MIQNLDVTPLVVLHGSLDPHALTMDINLVKTMNHIFGFRAIYYEFGNEDDALGVNAAHYVSAWNSIIPDLNRLLPRPASSAPPTICTAETSSRPFYNRQIRNLMLSAGTNTAVSAPGAKSSVFPTYPTGHSILRSEEHTSELQSPCNLVCRLLLEKKK